LLIRLEHTEADTVVVPLDVWVDVVPGPVTVAVLDGGTVWVVCESDDVSCCINNQWFMRDSIPGIVTVSVMVVESPTVTVLPGPVTVIVWVDPGKVLLPSDIVTVVAGSVMTVVTVVPGIVVPGNVTVVLGIVTVESEVVVTDVVDTGTLVTLSELEVVLVVTVVVVGVAVSVGVVVESSLVIDVVVVVVPGELEVVVGGTLELVVPGTLEVVVEGTVEVVGVTVELSVHEHDVLVRVV
jgi:hypothetical protein